MDRRRRKILSLGRRLGETPHRFLGEILGDSVPKADGDDEVTKLAEMIGVGRHQRQQRLGPATEVAATAEAAAVAESTTSGRRRRRLGVAAAVDSSSRREGG